MPENDASQNAEPNVLTPLDTSKYNLGKYASFDVSDQPMYGPDELGVLQKCVEDLSQSVTMADSSARIFEIIQAWEARLFDRGYQFVNSTKNGFQFAGASGRGASSGQEIIATQNSMKLFPVNVYGARKDKISPILSREFPPLKFCPKDPDSPVDQTTSDESDKYLKIWMTDANMKSQMRKIADLFYTDGRVMGWTRSVADQQRWGTDTIEQETVFGEEEPVGVVPETEDQDRPTQTEAPAIVEITDFDGKLEWKVPLYADEICDMGWVRRAKEVDADILKERYPWIEDKIAAGSSIASSADQYDRLARINVRLAVQTSSATGESWQKDATETHTWFRPSQYRAIKDKDQRQIFYDNFPDGLRVTHCGTALAFTRNESIDKHVTVMHAKGGSGQNRRAIGTNYLPLQKILNANISLLNRYFVGTVPRRFIDIDAIDPEAMGSQTNDPAVATQLKVPSGKTIDQVTSIEKVPQPTTGLFEFVQWVVNGAPEAMDCATPAMFGQEDSETAQLGLQNRDMSLGVYSQPWAEICQGMAMCATQAVQAAAANRNGSIRSRTPGQGRMTVELENLRGDAMCYPESMEIPQTLAEQEQRLGELVTQSPNVAIYNAIINDPRNLHIFASMPTLNEMEIPGLDAVEKQQGEFELLLQSGPLPNPQYQALEQLIQQGTQETQAKMQMGQPVDPQETQALQQAQQQMQSMPKQVSSVPVAPDGSENHVIEAAITLGMLNSSEGRKLKNGDEQQQSIYQNLKLHWQEHSAMAAKLAPPEQIPLKVNGTVDLTKLPPEPQAKAFQALGLEADPAQFENNLQPHEFTEETEGIGPSGLPVKQKVSYSGKGLN